MRNREQLVAAIMDEDERLQYDGKDPERIYRASEQVTKSFVSLLEAAAEIRSEINTEVNEDSARRMASARMDLVEAYAEALIAIHKFGATFRISGEAFTRMLKYLSGPKEAPLIMAGL